ncbi:MAG: TraB/GumN family protein [Piscinibacter sp.]|nr:TraB/GumN family protein [Piscinibacter sp.]
MATILNLALLLLALLAGTARAQKPDCPPPVSPPSIEMAVDGLRRAHDHGFLWQVSKDGRVSYLYGTLHVARRDWMFPGPRVRDALGASDLLALELDMLDPDTVRRMAAGAEGGTPAALPAALQRRLEQRARGDCADPALFARLAPEMKIAALTMLAARRQGLEAIYGIDLFLAGYARGQGLRVVGLETPEEQFSALSLARPDEAVALLASGLDELDSGQAQALLARLAQIWADGEYALLASYADWCRCLDTPAEIAAMRRLLDDRNPLLAQRIDALHAAGRRVFAAVGSLHMIGPQGLPALLEKRGYHVERIAFEASALDVRLLWDFGDPARSEAVFREHLARSGGDAALVLRTQIARTLGLRRRFDEGHRLLDAVDAELAGAGAGAEPQVRTLLERGRLWRSAGEPLRARPLFEQALERADTARLPELAIDALHMVALVEPDTAAQVEMNQRALERARGSADPRARRWEGSIANNLGMSLMDAGRHVDALQAFRVALAARERQGDRPQIREARWAVAWALRHLGRYAEALEILTALEREHAAAGSSDSYVFEELGENLMAQGEAAGARAWFARAHAAAAQESGSEPADAARLARLLERSR